MRGGIGPVGAALTLACAVAPGCSRTGLDDTVGFSPGTTGDTSPDASGSDGATLPAGSEDAALPSRSGGGDGGDIFTTGDDAPDGDGQGTGDCGAANCAGCCMPGGVCRGGTGSSACGHGGQRCMVCGPELACSFQGVCD